ncbi:MAG: hypothetical protein MJ224_07770, partial [archaeon]|nr:hypothetical protein [archaeon]
SPKFNPSLPDNKTVELNLSTFSNYFTMRPSSKRKVIFEIMNVSGVPVKDPKALYLIPKNSNIYILLKT